MEHVDACAEDSCHNSSRSQLLLEDGEGNETCCCRDFRRFLPNKDGEMHGVCVMQLREVCLVVDGTAVLWGGTWMLPGSVMLKCAPALLLSANRAENPCCAD